MDEKWKLHQKWIDEDDREIARIEKTRERYEAVKDKADRKAERKALKDYERELDRGLRIYDRETDKDF